MFGTLWRSPTWFFPPRNSNAEITTDGSINNLIPCPLAISVQRASKTAFLVPYWVRQYLM